MPRLRSFLTALAAVAMAGTILTSPASAGTVRAATPATPAPSTPISTTDTFGIQPATKTGPDKNRGDFSYEATGGSRKTDYVEVSNYSQAPLQLRLYASDAFNTDSGGFTILPSSTVPKTIGQWVKFPAEFITVPAKSAKIYSFTLDVPVGLGAGDYVGGVMVALTTMGSNAKGGQIDVENRVGVRMQVRVPGVLKAQLSIGNVSASYHESWNPVGSSSATVAYTVTNTGNVRLAGTQTVRVTSLIGGSQLSAPIAPIKELLPGNSERVTTTVNGVLPSFSSTVRISVVPTPVPGDVDPTLVSVEESTSMTTFPEVIFLILLLTCAYVVYRVIRSRRRAAAKKSAAGPKKSGLAKAKSAKSAKSAGGRPSAAARAGRASGSARAGATVNAGVSADVEADGDGSAEQ
jgi:Bacterial protein of unknown function (DUF916)